MKEKNQKKIDEATSKLLRLLVSGLYIIVFSLFTLVMFLLFEDQIKDWTTDKNYTPDQIEAMNKRVRAVERMEAEEKNWDKVIDGIHVRTGLKTDKDLQLIISACTSCHSSKLITQNKATRSGWKSMIVWMQETQGLPDLGKAEPKILDYLARHYAPTNTGRRKNLDVAQIEWYVLNLSEPER